MLAEVSASASTYQEASVAIASADCVRSVGPPGPVLQLARSVESSSPSSLSLSSGLSVSASAGSLSLLSSIALTWTTLIRSLSEETLKLTTLGHSLESVSTRKARLSAKGLDGGGGGILRGGDDLTLKV